MSKEEGIVKGICPRCGNDKKANVKGKATRDVSFVDEEMGGHRVDWYITYKILECRGCGEIYFERTEYCSEWGSPYDFDDLEEKTYWPAKAKRAKPDWLNKIVDRKLNGIVTELYTALDNGLSVLAATGVRTAVDRVTELLGINPSLTFKQKLDELVKAGHLAAGERQTFDVLIDAGSAAAHRAWKPSDQQLNVMMQILENFLHKHFISPDEVQALKSGVPPKPRRNRRSGSTST